MHQRPDLEPRYLAPENGAPRQQPYHGTPSAIERAEQVVRDHPWAAFGVATVAGAAIGKMSRSGGILGSLIGAVAGLAGRAAIRTAIAHGITEVAGRVQEH